ncbi:MAG: TPM domain-containing protein, partial [Verrucomicrobia bacterium]|nr:TPM domain-containing protein [Verrucomicrobiota bacterium]
ISGSLLTEKATPIMVVTIESMAKYGGEGLRIETFANLLFDQWQIGNQNLGEDYWNTGILLLVSKNDRKARIELGAGWGRSEDAICREIMDQYIIPQFKRGDFSAGIVAGVKALDKMGRKLELPGHVKVVSSKARDGDKSERLADKQRMGETHHAHGSVFERPWRQLAVGGVFLGIVVFTIVSLVRKGASGWA